MRQKTKKKQNENRLQKKKYVIYAFRIDDNKRRLKIATESQMHENEV